MLITEPGIILRLYIGKEQTDRCTASGFKLFRPVNQLAGITFAPGLGNRMHAADKGR